MQEVLANVTEGKPTTPGTMGRLFEKKPKGKPPVNKKRSANMHAVSYRVVNAASSMKRASLIDRGANGGVAGMDGRTLMITDRRLDLTGVDDHQVKDLSIVVHAGVFPTTTGPIIGICNQYAKHNQPTSIHSSLQMET